jgi:hypothetical protein
MSVVNLARPYLPILDWGAKYNGKTFTNDLIVAGIVTVMLIPQSLAYALLAGLPAQVGLYASMAPLVLYAIFGTSRALAVGPVAVASLMTAAAAAKVATQGTPEYLGATIALAVVSGLLLIVMGLLRLGFLANFLSHPVISGFITASGIQIAAGQLAPVLGIHAEGESFVDLLQSMIPNLSHINPYTAVIGFASLAFLFGVRWNVLQGKLEFMGPLLLGTFEQTKQWIEPIVGLKLNQRLRGPLSFTMEGDISGFGAGSDFAWQLWPAIGIDVSKRAALKIGYRVLSEDYDTGSGNQYFKYDVITQAMAFGMAFRF